MDIAVGRTIIFPYKVVDKCRCFITPFFSLSEIIGVTIINILAVKAQFEVCKVPRFKLGKPDLVVKFSPKAFNIPMRQ